MSCIRSLVATENHAWQSDSDRIHTFEQYVACSYMVDVAKSFSKAKKAQVVHNNIPAAIIKNQKSGLVKHGSSVYMFGGFAQGSKPNKHFFTFNEISGVWYDQSSLVPPEMKARCNHYTQLMNNSLIIMGGLDEHNKWLDNDAWSYHCGKFCLYFT